MNLDLIKVKDSTDEDISFIIDSWLHNYRKKSDRTKDIPKGIYYSNQYKIISKIIERSRGFTIVDAKDPELIYAYIIFQAVKDNPNIIPIVHYVYVRASCRKMGFAKLLINKVKDYIGAPKNIPLAVTHQTKDSLYYLKNYKLIYNPYLLDSM